VPDRSLGRVLLKPIGERGLIECPLCPTLQTHALFAAGH